MGVLMPTTVGPAMISRARSLRSRMTLGEKKFWLQLRNWRATCGVHVRKQAPIGPYVADFVIHKLRLVIEIDGDQHATREGLLHDRKRDKWLEEKGYRVLRFTTADLAESLDGCLETVLRELEIANAHAFDPHP